jgi:hypothetical protein
LIKLVTMAALAAFAVSAPANASEIRISTAGKTIAQLDAEITAAARTVCERDTVADVRSAYDTCLRVSLSAAKQQLQQFAAANRTDIAKGRRHAPALLRYGATPLRDRLTQRARTPI